MIGWKRFWLSFVLIVVIIVGGCGIISRLLVHPMYKQQGTMFRVDIYLPARTITTVHQNGGKCLLLNWYWIAVHLKCFTVVVRHNVERHTHTHFSLQHSVEHLVRLLLPSVTRPVGQTGLNHQMILIQVVTKRSRRATTSFSWDVAWNCIINILV